MKINIVIFVLLSFGFMARGIDDGLSSSSSSIATEPTISTTQEDPLLLLPAKFALLRNVLHTFYLAQFNKKFPHKTFNSSAANILSTLTADTAYWAVRRNSSAENAFENASTHAAGVCMAELEIFLCKKIINYSPQVQNVFNIIEQNKTVHWLFNNQATDTYQTWNRKFARFLKANRIDFRVTNNVLEIANTYGLHKLFTCSSNVNNETPSIKSLLSPKNLLNAASRISWVIEYNADNDRIPTTMKNSPLH